MALRNVCIQMRILSFQYQDGEINTNFIQKIIRSVICAAMQQLGLPHRLHILQASHSNSSGCGQLVFNVATLCYFRRRNILCITRGHHKSPSNYEDPVLINFPKIRVFIRKALTRSHLRRNKSEGLYIAWLMRHVVIILTKVNLTFPSMNSVSEEHKRC
jgi:hypothetical protein